MNSVCNICGSNVSQIFRTFLLNKHHVDYFQCGTCEFIQTEKPYWLNEAYANAMTSIDVGLVFRNGHFSTILPPILDAFSTPDDSYIDYGGGYGLFVRMMRDKGYDFYLQDKYAENIFAKHFELKDYRKIKFIALTAFEVFEHLEDPIRELESMFQLSDTVIFSTELQPSGTFNSPSDWWYFSPETGQHISFYSKKSLDAIAEKVHCKVYSNGSNLHIFSKAAFKVDPVNAIEAKQEYRSIFSKFRSRFFSKVRNISITRQSLLKADFDLYKEFALKKD